MAEIEGKMRICERCGSIIFLKQTGKTEQDGGFITIKNHDYEKAEGWKHHLETGCLCPDCEDAYINLMSDFMDNKHHEITINGCEKEFYNFKERAEDDL